MYSYFLLVNTGYESITKLQTKIPTLDNIQYNTTKLTKVYYVAVTLVVNKADEAKKQLTLL